MYAMCGNIFHLCKGSNGNSRTESSIIEKFNKKKRNTFTLHARTYKLKKAKYIVKVNVNNIIIKVSSGSSKLEKN